MTPPSSSGPGRAHRRGAPTSAGTGSRVSESPRHAPSHLPARRRARPRRPCRPGRPGRLAVLAAAGTAAAADRSVELRFDGEFAGGPFDCTTTYDGVGATSASVDVTDYRLFVSNVALVRADGTAVPVALEQDDRWQTGDVALLDFENGAGRCDNGTPETNALVRGTVPEGEYAGVAFDLGVPFDDNHGDPTLQDSPLNLTAMFWNRQGGYRFLKLDTVPAMAVPATTVSGHGADPAPTARGDAKAPGHGGSGHRGGHGGPVGAWMLHVGSSGCASASRTSAPTSAVDCAAPNRPRVTLDGFDVDAGRIVVDPAPALAGTDLAANAPDTAPGCMSAQDDPDCAAVRPMLGIASDGATPEQRLFTVRRDAP